MLVLFKFRFKIHESPSNLLVFGVPCGYTSRCKYPGRVQPAKDTEEKITRVQKLPTALASVG